MSSSDHAIGGYLELELPARRASLYPEAFAFQSARAAFLALLRTGEPRRVWMPYYICETMLTSLEQADVQVEFYGVDLNLHIADEIEMKDGDWLLYVNYFGVRDAYTRSVLTRFDPECVVIDCSQALFSAPYHCLATIYSPRKFLGVPDGGFLDSSIPVPVPELVDDGALGRSSHLIKRLAFSAEDGYSDHQHANKSLERQEPKRMSDLTRRILSTVDYEEVARTRKRNFDFLHKHLGEYNLLQIDSGAVSGPLCYPLLIQSAQLREFLTARRIFVPTYWPDVLARVDRSQDEASLVRGVFPLPCDQRYEEVAMQRVVDACLEYLREQ